MAGDGHAPRQALQLSDLPRYFRLAFHDLFTREVLLAAAFPFLLTLVLFAGQVTVLLAWLLPWLRDRLAWLEGGPASPIFDFLLGLGLVGIFAILNVLLALTLIGVFFTEKLVAHVNGIHYRKRLFPFGSSWLIIRTSFRYFFRFAGLFLLLSPLYLVPGVNLIAFAIPSYLFFRKSVLFDVGSQVVSRPVYERLLGRRKHALSLLTVPLYLLTYAPVIGIFSYVYAFLVVTHFFLDQGEAGGAGRMETGG